MRSKTPETCIGHTELAKLKPQRVVGGGRLPPKISNSAHKVKENSYQWSLQKSNE